MADLTPPPSSPASARFTLELEFVHSLSNPYYLSHLALVYPHLLHPSPPEPTGASTAAPDSDASRFAAYLAYLYAYWRTPQYSKYLSHPGAVLRNLELLQQEHFRKDIIRPDVIAKLLEGGVSDVNGQSTRQGEQAAKEGAGFEDEEGSGERLGEMGIATG